MLSVLLLATAPWAVAQEARIAYVDMKVILDNAPQVVAGRERLDQEFRTRNDALRDDESRLQQLLQQLSGNTNQLGSESNNNVPLDNSARLRIEQESRLLQRSVERRREDLRQELQLRRNEEIGRVEVDINQAIASIARAQGYDLIVASPVVFASSRIDITQLILQHLRQEHAADQAEQEQP